MLEKTVFVNFLLLVLLLAACGGSNNMKVSDIALPDRVRATTENGAFEVRYDLSIVEASKKLKKDYRQVDRNEQILIVPNELEWSDITKFYDEKLSRENFSRDAQTIENLNHYRMAVWKKKNWTNEQAVAVILIEDKSYETGSTMKMLAVFTAEK